MDPLASRFKEIHEPAVQRCKRRADELSHSGTSNDAKRTRFSPKHSPRKQAPSILAFFCRQANGNCFLVVRARLVAPVTFRLD